MSVKLPLPCPFCGRSPHVSPACNDPSLWLVSCPMYGDGCPAWPEVQQYGHDAAIDEWNTRDGVQASRHIEAAIELDETAEFGTIGNPVVGHYHRTDLVAGLGSDWGDELADPKADIAGIALLRNAAPALIECARALGRMYRESHCKHDEPGCCHHDASTALAALDAAVEGKP